jgi:hypothetical protein
MLLAQRITFLLQAVALFVLLLYGIMFIQHAIAVIRFPYQMDYGEGLEIYAVARLQSGQPLYGDITQPPYHTLEYPPLYTLVVSPVAALVGLRYAAGRAVSVMLALVIAGLLGRLVYEETHLRWTGVATGLLWLASHFVYSWAVLMREDMLSLTFSLLGLYFFWRGYIRQGRARYVMVAMVLFVAAAYSRATAAWAAAACLAYLALTRRWKLASQALALYAGLGLAVFGLLQVVTGGEFFRHLVLYNLQPWMLSRWLAALGRAWAMYPPAILAGLAMLGLALLRRWPALPALYMALAWLSSATTGKIGAYFNHMLEASAATWLACGLMLGWASRSKKGLWPLVASAALLVQAALLVHLPYSLQSGVLPPWTALKPALRAPARASRAAYLWTPSDADAQAAAPLDQRVRETPGLILSEDGSFTATHGRPMWIQFQPFTQLAKNGVWDQTEFVEQIRSRQFALMLLQFDTATDVRSYRPSIMTAEMLDAMRESYVLEKQIWLYYVYVPRTAP